MAIDIVSLVIVAVVVGAPVIWLFTLGYKGAHRKRRPE